MTKLLALGTALILLAACGTAPRSNEATVVARFFLEEAPGAGVPVTLPQSEVTIAISPKPVITEFDIANVEIAQVELGRCLLFQLTPAAGRDVYRLTGTSPGRRLVLLVNGRAVGARRIERPLENGVVMIFVELPDEELPQLVRELKEAAAILKEGRKS